MLTKYCNLASKEIKQKCFTFFCSAHYIKKSQVNPELAKLIPPKPVMKIIMAEILIDYIVNGRD